MTEFKAWRQTRLALIKDAGGQFLFQLFSFCFNSQKLAFLNQDADSRLFTESQSVCDDRVESCENAHFRCCAQRALTGYEFKKIPDGSDLHKYIQFIMKN